MCGWKQQVQLLTGSLDRAQVTNRSRRPKVRVPSAWSARPGSRAWPRSTDRKLPGGPYWAMGHPSPKSRDVKGLNGLREHLQTSGDHSQTIQSRKQHEATIPKCPFQVYSWCKPITWRFFRPRRLCILTTCFRGWQYQASGHPHRSEWVMCEVHWSTWIYDHFFGDWLTTYVSGQIPVAFNLYVSTQSMPVLWPLPNAFGNLLLKKMSCVPVESLREVEVLLQVPATTNSMLRPLPPVPLHLSACRQRPSDKGISLTLLRFIKRKICLLEVSQHGGTQNHLKLDHFRSF